MDTGKGPCGRFRLPAQSSLEPGPYRTEAGYKGLAFGEEAARPERLGRKTGAMNPFPGSAGRVPGPHRSR